MRKISALRYIGLILIAVVGIVTILGSGGGGGGGTTSNAPVLSNFMWSPSSVAAGLTLTINGSFDFSDPNGNLNGGSFNYTYHGSTYTFQFPPEFAGVTNATVVFELLAVLDSSTGTEAIPVWLVDNTGLSSNIVQVDFTQLWTRQFGTALEDIGEGIAIDSSDHVLVAGTTSGSLEGEANPGGPAVFVTKYATDTSRVWTRVFGSSSADTGRAVARDGADNVYVVGDTLGTFFDGIVADGSLNGFLTKFNSGGTRQWTNLIGTAASERAHGVATDSNNNVYVVGETTGALDGEPNTGDWDAFVMKFNSSGTRLWTRLLGSAGSDTAYGLAIDGNGNVYVTGATDGVLGIDPSPGDAVVNFDAFVAKYAPDGTRLWVTQLGTSCTEWSNSIALGAGGNLYVAGKIYQCAFPGNAASGGYDAFVAYLDGSGTVAWVRQFGTSDHDSANSVATDSTGNAYVTGFLGSLYFNEDNEGHAIFLAKYDTAGNQAWLTQDTAGFNFGNQGRGVSVDSSNSIFVTGTVHGQLDGHTNPNLGEDDAFILKFDVGGTRR